MKQSDNAWVTLVTSEDFLKGAILLQENLKKVKSIYPLIVIITDNIQQPIEGIDNFIIYPYIEFTKKSYYSCTKNKFYIYKLIQYDKLIFLDADIEFLENCDHYFEYEIPCCFLKRNKKEICGGTILVKPDNTLFIKSMEIKNASADEEIWPQLYSNWNYFPYKDMHDTDHWKFIHWDGYPKPWMN